MCRPKRPALKSETPRRRRTAGSLHSKAALRRMGRTSDDTGKKVQEEYPGIVHCLRVKKEEDLDADLASWLQEAYDHHKRQDQGQDEEE
jgi:hypothetical protein